MQLTLVGTTDRNAQSCIDACANCHQACMETIYYCYELGNEYTEPSHLRLLYDCARICSTLQDSATLNAPSFVPLSRVAAEVCTICAQSCEAFEEDRPMGECAAVCRSCAAACSAVAS